MREVSWSKAGSGVLHAASLCWSRILPCRCLCGSPGCTPSWLTSTCLHQQLSIPLHPATVGCSHPCVHCMIRNKGGDDVLRKTSRDTCRCFSASSPGSSSACMLTGDRLKVTLLPSCLPLTPAPPDLPSGLRRAPSPLPSQSPSSLPTALLGSASAPPSTRPEEDACSMSQRADSRKMPGTKSIGPQQHA